MFSWPSICLQLHAVIRRRSGLSRIALRGAFLLWACSTCNSLTGVADFEVEKLESTALAGAAGSAPDGGSAATESSGGSAGSDSEQGPTDAGGISMSGAPSVVAEPLIGIGFVGARCESDADCNERGGLTCLAADSYAFALLDSDGARVAGGPQGGYCTIPCTSNDDCLALDGTSACWTGLTGQGYCIALCLPGDIDTDGSASDGSVKCGAGERAQACFQFPEDPALGACFPTCWSNEGCGPGRFCDPGAFGLCVDVAPAGGGIGAPCTPETQVADCASDVCLTYADPTMPGTIAGGFCSANCAFGSLYGCGFGPESTGLRAAACLQGQSEGGSDWDAGYCFELCDVDDDCVQAAWVCEPFGPGSDGVELQAALGRLGQCVPQSVSNG